MSRLGKIPKQGQELRFGQFLFQITRSDGRRILSMDLFIDHTETQLLQT
jgi:Mg2+/Co2+ transporter CorC